jgi:AraC-like DNA-binding protein
VSRIREQLGEASSWQDRFALVDAVLARRRETGPSVDPEVAWAWDRIAVSRGRARVEELAVEVGWSRKRLWSRFRSQAGVPPKRAARLVRFDHAAHRLAAGGDAARVAAEGGYVDQSHLHRDVLAFSGMTPAAVASQVWLAVDKIAWGTFVQDPRP